MTRVLSELLAAEEPLFGMAIKQLEQASGNNSVDVRLTAEIIGKVHMKMRSLGLDPADTTGLELYRALFNLVKKHDTFLAERIGGEDPEDVQKMLPRIKEVVEALDVPKTAWLLKYSVAKRLLKAMPPKHVMKHLGYRSIDSMLKREPIGELFGAMRFLESSHWLDKFVNSYKTLTPNDFEVRKIEIINLDPNKWGDSTGNFVGEKRHNITHLKEMGVVLMLPMPVKRMPGITITALPLLLHYINEIRLYSSFFKMQQVRSDFAKVVVDTLIADPGKHAALGNQHVHWRVIHRYFGSQAEGNNHPDIFEPHVEPGDLTWRKTEETLYRLEPALHFWHDIDYVGVEFDGRPVSFNLMDVAVSYVNNLPYGQQAVHHFRDSLWNEIFMRYLGEKTLEKQVLKQLDNEMIEPEILAIGLKGKL
jgi:hypothetical protein